MRAALALAAALLAAGCLAGSDVAPAAARDEATSAERTGFALVAEGCVSGGFISSYHGSPKLANVWQTADIREELGNPIRDSVGMPTIGPLFGNWHIGIACEKVEAAGETASDYAFGWVGAMIERPAWDHGGADLHFLLAGLAFDGGPIGEALRAATTADVTHAQEVRFDWLVPRELPRSAVYARFVDAERGVYESWSEMQRHRDLPERSIRFWWAVPADGSESRSGHAHTTGVMAGRYHPVYFDMRVGGGAHHLTPPAGGVELASHNMLEMEHGPVLAQPCTTAVYEQPTLRFELGRVVEDVLLHEVWTH